MNQSDDDDSFDQELANLEIPVEPKKPRLSNEPVASASAPASTTDPKTADNPLPKNRAASTNCILVNAKQRGNPILKSITNVPWEYDTIVPDYIVGKTACVLYLSLKYHNLNPDYITGRLKQLGKMFEFRVLLVQVDTKVSF